MGRTKGPRHVIELPLKAEPWQISLVKKRIEAARQVYNAVIGGGLKRLRLVRQSKDYRAAAKMPKGKPKSKERIARGKAFKASYAKYSLTKDELRTWSKQFGREMSPVKGERSRPRSWLGEHLDSQAVQAISDHAWEVLEDYLYNKKGRPKFRRYGEKTSIENQSNNSGLVWVKGQIKWNVGNKKLILPAIIDTKDPVIQHGLTCKVMRPRLILRAIGRQEYLYTQLVVAGKPWVPVERERREGTVGVDIGPSMVAYDSAYEAGVHSLCPDLADRQREIRKLQRKLDRQKRANNPDNFNEDGTIKPRSQLKRWVVSNKQRKTQRQLANLHRKLAAHRRNQHGQTINHLLTLGDSFKTEKVSTKGWQKLWGKSIGKYAPGEFIAHLKRRAEGAGFEFSEINTFQTALSQHCFVCETKKKKSLSVRVHDCGCGVISQRDLFSAFGARAVYKNEDGVDCVDFSWTRNDWSEGGEERLRKAWEEAYALEKNGNVRKGVLGKPK